MKRPLDLILAAIGLVSVVGGALILYAFADLGWAAL